MIDEKAQAQIADQASRLMAAGWRGNPNMSGDDRDFMTHSMRRKHDDKVRSVVDFVLSQVEALSPGSTGETEGWQPIETFDGSEAYVLIFDGSYVSEARYQPSGKGWWLANTHPTDAYDGRVCPTHWRPLPSPPSAMLAAAGGRDE